MGLNYIGMHSGDGGGAASLVDVGGHVICASHSVLSLFEAITSLATL